MDQGANSHKMTHKTNTNLEAYNVEFYKEALQLTYSIQKLQKLLYIICFQVGNKTGHFYVQAWSIIAGV